MRVDKTVASDVETVLPYNVERAWWGVGLLPMVKASLGF